MKITAWEVTNTTGNHNKFYRCYALDDGREIRHYGPIGAPVGQTRALKHSHVGQALVSAEQQIRSKEQGGYRGRLSATYDVPGTMPSLGVIADTFTAMLADAKHQSPEPTAETTSPSVAEIAERALMAIATASSAPKDAVVEFAQLRQDWTEQELAIERARSYLDTLEQLVTM